MANPWWIFEAGYCQEWVTEFFFIEFMEEALVGVVIRNEWDGLA